MGRGTLPPHCAEDVSHVPNRLTHSHMLSTPQGVLASMKAIMEGVGPMFFAFAMTAAEKTPLPGLPWIFGAACMAISLALCCLLESYCDVATQAARYAPGDGATEMTAALGGGEKWPEMDARRCEWVQVLVCGGGGGGGGGW